MPKKASTPIATVDGKSTFTNLLATCVRSSKYVESKQKTITHYESNDSLIESWSFEGKPHNVAIGQRVLLTKVVKPDGTVFYNIE